MYSSNWLLSFYPSKEASISPGHCPTGSHQGRRRNFAYSPRTERAPPPQWIWSLWYPLLPSFQAARRRHLVPSRPASGGVDSSPERLLHSETHGSRTSSSNPAAALFHKLRLVPLLPGSGRILVQLINVKNNWTEIPGLGIPHLRVVPIPII